MTNPCAVCGSPEGSKHDTVLHVAAGTLDTRTRLGDAESPTDLNNPHLAAMIGCIVAARRLGQTDPSVDLLARALTATMSGRPAAARTFLQALNTRLDRIEGTPS